MNELITIIDLISFWVKDGSRKAMDNASKALAVDYRNLIKSGKDASGSDLIPLRKSTLETPVKRRLQGSPIRKHLGATPLYATGKTVQSIQAERKDANSWTISSTTDLGNSILASNATSTHKGHPFYGDTPKAVRDPLTVEKKQLDIIEDNILEDLTIKLNSL